MNGGGRFDCYRLLVSPEDGARWAHGALPVEIVHVDKIHKLRHERQAPVEGSLLVTVGIGVVQEL